tara:strand:- start:656 stop:844 length:189 start_codon:yes stop_codon:yes gene_type:complete
LQPAEIDPDSLVFSAKVTFYPQTLCGALNVVIFAALGILQTIPFVLRPLALLNYQISQSIKK